jgi:hypothetical protein
MGLAIGDPGGDDRGLKFTTGASMAMPFVLSTHNRRTLTMETLAPLRTDWIFTLADSDELAAVLAQCTIHLSIEVLRIDCPRSLWKSFDLGLLRPERLDVSRIEFYRDGILHLHAQVGFWIGYRDS